MKTRVAVALVLTIAYPQLMGCAALAPSATKADADRVLQQAARYERTGVQNLGASDSFRKPIRPGQWVATLARSKSDPNDVTLQVTKVGSVSGNSVRLETEMYGAANRGQRHVMSHTVRNFPTKARTAYSSEDAASITQDIEITDIRMMDEKGEVVAMPQLPFGMGKAASNLIANSVATGQIRTEPCANTHFKASKCFLVPFSSSVLWMSDTGTTYAHSAIPVLGFLRSESQNHDMEVIGFGESGAEILIR